MIGGGPLNFVAKSRVIVSRLFGAIIIAVMLFTCHSFSQSAFIDTAMESSGLLLLTICSFGRLWALIFIRGYKSNQLVTEGPYSIVRHPLYLFSLIGAIGLGLASENVIVLALIIVFYLFYYPFTIIAEEKKLIEKFGKQYLDYAKTTPRFIPKLANYKQPTIYTIHTKDLLKSFAESMLFIWAFLFMHFVETCQTHGILPVFYRFP